MTASAQWHAVLLVVLKLSPSPRQQALHDHLSSAVKLFDDAATLFDNYLISGQPLESDGINDAVFDGTVALLDYEDELARLGRPSGEDLSQYYLS